MPNIIIINQFNKVLFIAMHQMPFQLLIDGGQAAAMIIPFKNWAGCDTDEYGALV